MRLRAVGKANCMDPARHHGQLQGPAFQVLRRGEDTGGDKPRAMIAFCIRFITISTPAVPRQRPVAGSSLGSAAFKAQRKRSASSPSRVMWLMTKQGASSTGKRPTLSSGMACRRASGCASCCSRKTRSRSCCRSNLRVYICCLRLCRARPHMQPPTPARASSTRHAPAFLCLAYETTILEQLQPPAARNDWGLRTIPKNIGTTTRTGNLLSALTAPAPCEHKSAGYFIKATYFLAQQITKCIFRTRPN